MQTNARINPGTNLYPSAPPMFDGPPSYSSNPHFMASSPQPNPSSQQQPPGMLNVPPMMYSVPGTVQGQPTPSPLLPPMAALKPIPQPPPAPSLNEVTLNEERQRVRCPFCYASITTKVSYATGTMTHIAAVAVLVVCCPLFWIPYLVDCCKDVDHSCPNCGRAIGKFRRFT